MSVGEGIFLSAVILGGVGLFAATKDRWNWKRIAKWGLGLPLALIAIFALGLWVYSSYEGRPVAQTEFEGIHLSATTSDVRFRKGEPIQKRSTQDRWVYGAHSSSADSDDAFLLVQFLEGKLKFIAYLANDRQIVNPYLLGFTIGSDYDAVLQKLGKPSNVSVSADGLRRLLSYEKYRVFFAFERGKVNSFGIFQPSAGPMKFLNEIDPSAPLVR